jgi:uncharacterized membrane protein YdbT with pleckstrin-like domain
VHAKSITRQLAEVELFADLKQPQLRALANIVQRVEYGPGLTVYNQGQAGHEFFVVETGILRVVHVDIEGKVLEVRQLRPGDAFGETSLLLGDVRDATVEAVHPATLLRIEKEDFDRLLEEEPRTEAALNMRPDIKERRQYPQFSWLDEGELPVRVMHKHPVVLITPLLLPIILDLILLSASLVARSLWGDPIMFVGLLLMIFPTGAGIYFYIDWRNDVYAVTNHRVIHMERIGLFRESFAAAPLHAVEDVQQIHAGPLARIFDFGDLIMETAGEMGQVVFRSVPNLAEVRNIVFEQAERNRARSRVDERGAIRKALRHHFVGEEDAAQVLETDSEDHLQEEETEETKGWRRLLNGARLLQHLLPPTWQRAGDTITWRKHWSALIRPLTPPLLILGTTTVLILIVSSRMPDLTLRLLFPYALDIVIMVPWLLWQFENWQNDFYQITPHRLIHVDRLPFYLREERREASLEKITSVRFEQSVLGRFLAFGNVFVETHAEEGGFDLMSVKNPQKVQSEIFSRMEAYRRRRTEQEAQRHQRELLDWFSVYDEIRRTHTPSTDQEESV